VGGIIMWSGAVAAIPAGWALCDGDNGTPDLRDRFVVGAGNGYAVGAKGGATTHTHAIGGSATLSGNVGATTLTTEQMPSHAHSMTYRIGSGSVTVQTTPQSIANYTNNQNTSATGGGTSHTHSISGSASLSGNTGSASSLPPYYALAYIMFIGENNASDDNTE
jgi:microcystin-dependent protein